MNAEIICIGDELLIGQTVNTNAAWMGEQLNLSGIRVTRTHTISDHEADILDTLRDAENRADIILITGGLGPTRDDITKTTLCKFFNTHLVMNETVLARITDYFNARGLPMLDTNRDQAMLPAECRVIHNMRGTACGMWFNKGNKVFVSMPGVPYEMIGMMQDEILPSLKSHFRLKNIFHHTILTVGVGESFLAKKIEAWEENLEADGIRLAYLPSPGMVKLRMSAYQVENENSMQALFAKHSEALSQLIGEYIYGYGTQTIQQVIGQILTARGQTLSTAESCTGGYIAHLITQVPGSSAYYKGSAVCYTENLKTQILKVPADLINNAGVVSSEVAAAMASGARKEWGTDWAVATTGVAGPEGGTQDNPVGTVWIAVSGPDVATTEKFSLGKSRERTIQVASTYALNLLRKEILRCNA